MYDISQTIIVKYNTAAVSCPIYPDIQNTERKQFQTHQDSNPTHLECESSKLPLDHGEYSVITKEELLKNREAMRKLNINWQGQILEHSFTPKYLGVKLDRTLSYKEHCMGTKSKVMSRNNIIRKLTGTKWGANPNVLRTSALALCFSAGEYAAPVWKNSAHAKQVDVSLNEAVRIVTGTMKPTPLHKIYPIVGIAPPDVRRQVAAETERGKQINDTRHTLHQYEPQLRRLKSRKSFMASTQEIPTTPEARRIDLWKQKVPISDFELQEKISKGENLPYPTWKTINRLRTGVGRCKLNMLKWKLSEDDKCECGSIQTMQHLLVCPKLPTKCNSQDLLEANNQAVEVARYWQETI